MQACTSLSKFCTKYCGKQFLNGSPGISRKIFGLNCVCTLWFWVFFANFKSFLFWESRFVQLADGEASACGKRSSVHVGPSSYGCRVDSSVHQSFHARFCKFSLRSAQNCRISESTIHCNSCLHVLNWVCTLWFWHFLANFKSSSFDDARFAQLADSRASACGKHPSVHIGSSS